MREQKTHCKRGHQLTPAGSYCKPCRRFRDVLKYRGLTIEPRSDDDPRRVECECGRPRIYPNWKSPCEECRVLDMQWRAREATVQQVHVSEEW